MLVTVCKQPIAMEKCVVVVVVVVALACVKLVTGTKNLLLVVLVASRKSYLALASMKNTRLPSNTETAKTAAQTGNREAFSDFHCGAPC